MKKTNKKVPMIKISIILEIVCLLSILCIPLGLAQLSFSLLTVSFCIIIVEAFIVCIKDLFGYYREDTYL